MIDWINNVLQGAERHLENYKFDPESSIISRVKKPNQYFLSYIQTMENQARPSKILNEEEKKVIGDAISLLPPLHKQIIQNRVIEICFLKNLGSSGWADWVVGNTGDLYCVLAFDRETLSMGLGDWLESRENTCFGTISEGIEIDVNTGSEYSGFFGILLHETTHVVDYILNITPFIEPSIYALFLKQQKKFRENYPFVEDVWNDMYTPVTPFNYTLRDSVTFYRATEERKLMFQDASVVYNQLSTTPFVSLFGSKNWADDLAEFVLFYHLTQKLKQPYTISIIKEENIIYSYKPMENQAVTNRFPTLDMFYCLE